MPAENRKFPRREINQPVVMVNDRGVVLGSCLMVDVSRGGAKLRLNLARSVPKDFFLLMNRGHLRVRCSVSWRNATTMGVRFVVAS